MRCRDWRGRWGAACIVAMGLLLTGGEAHAQGVVEQPRHPEERRASQASPAPEASPAARAQPGEPLLETDPEVRAALKELVLARYRREGEILAERKGVVAWTNWASRVIFWVVHTVLVLMLALSLVEFVHALRTRRRSRQESHELKLGLEGIALKTSLHGILLLGAACGLYFLYVKFVLPVTAF